MMSWWYTTFVTIWIVIFAVFLALMLYVLWSDARS